MSELFGFLLFLVVVGGIIYFKHPDSKLGKLIHDGVDKVKEKFNGSSK